jgi:uncharacterized protein with FMN-binding domain
MIKKGNIFKMSNNFFIVGAIILLLGAGLVLFEMSKTRQAVNAIIISKDITSVLRQMPDGDYEGECTPGKLLSVRSKVTVQNGKIVTVELLEHINGRGKSAEILTDRIVQEQSLNLDMVTGATHSSKAILKSVENALTN